MLIEDPLCHNQSAVGTPDEETIELFLRDASLHMGIEQLEQLSQGFEAAIQRANRRAVLLNMLLDICGLRTGSFLDNEADWNTYQAWRMFF
jgi:hypothetical protein